MRIAVLADVHGNLLALDAVLGDMAAFRPDVVVDLGDCVAGPLWPKETLARLDRLGALTVRGNHERQVIDSDAGDMGPTDRYTYQQLSDAERQRLGGLPTTRTLEGGVLMCHASPGSDMTYLMETIVDGCLTAACPLEVDGRLVDVEAKLILCAHSHQARVTRTATAGIWLLNPGAIGLPAFVGEGYVSESSSPHARYAIVDWDGTTPQVTQRLVIYDWEAAARRAENNERSDWAVALRTGLTDRAMLKGRA